MAIGTGLIGWAPLAFAAGEAQGDAANTRRIAIALILAGTTSVVALFAATVGVTAGGSRPRPIALVASAVGLLLGAAMGLTTLVFALSFHW